jgi:hypothetical protein
LVKLLAGPWVKDFLDEAELFPFSAHDDQVDAAALAFNKLAAKRQFWLRIGGETFGGQVVGEPGRGPRIVETLKELEL